MQEMTFGSTTTREHLLRPQTGQKMKLKEKFVEIYDMFLRGQDPALGKDPEVFWDELFLIKVNAEYLSSSLRRISEDELLAIKDGINSIFLHAVQTMRDPLPQRRLHAMQTLTIVLGEVFRKGFNNWSFDVIHLLTGLSHADLVFRTLLQGLCDVLDGEESQEMQVVALRLAIALACGNDNVNKNSLNEYFMQKDMFPSLIKFFVKIESVEVALEALALLSLLANYNKYETRNPYLERLSGLTDEKVLHKMVVIIVQIFDRIRKSYTEVMDDDELSTVSKLTGAFSYFTGMLWNPKGQDSTATDAAFATLRIPVLLVLYDLINSNKRFLSLFISFSVPTKDTDHSNQTSVASQGSIENSETALGAFLSFSSYLLQHNRTQRSAPYTHLCLIIMLILVEDTAVYPYLCAIPSAQDMATPQSQANQSLSLAQVRLCRQRQPLLPKAKTARPLAAVLLDVILGFLKHNMKKKMQIDCFRLAVAIVFAISSRFKTLRVRLRKCLVDKAAYHWVEMWTSLQGLVKFLQANAKTFQHLPDARDLVAETIDVVNYFVTYGDLIMPDPGSLYALYYEIVRSGIDPYLDLTRDFNITIHPPLPAPLPHHDLTSRNRLNLAPSPQPSPSDSGLGSPPTTSPPSSPYPHSIRSPSPAHSSSHNGSHSRAIIIDLSNINQVHTFFFTHLLAWRDQNPTRSLGPDLVSTIIKDHYQDLTLVPSNLDAFLVVKHGKHPGQGGGGVIAKNDSGPHPAWDGYTEVPDKVPFFRQLTRWVVTDIRKASRTHAAFNV
ncbi:hypothetical protein BGZ83_007007 [Gryganskiella cystojenkinii]|nr:hypothetical protein BGZ83_007007 [Gryganskiella cystojenkinii]